MNCLKFDLYGRYAFFKNPEINNYKEFSYNHIHKPALLGILGATLGLNGRGQIVSNKIDYYEKLKDIKVSIVPYKPLFDSFEEVINNSSGFANKGGETQNIRRQILQDIRWTIYIFKDSVETDIYNKLLNHLNKKESVYPIYLGNNSFFAKIDDVEEIKIELANNIKFIDSLFPYRILNNNGFESEKEKYYYEEYLPIELNKMSLYNTHKMVFTNYRIDVIKNDNVFYTGERILYFS